MIGAIIILNTSFHTNISNKVEIISIKENNDNNIKSNYIEGVYLENGKESLPLQTIKMEIRNHKKDNLHINVTFDEKKEGGGAVLLLQQDDVTEYINIDILGKDLKYPLNNFKEGEILISFLFNDVENVKYKIAIK